MRDARLRLALLIIMAVSCKGNAGSAASGTAGSAAAPGSGTASVPPATGSGTASAAPTPPASGSSASGAPPATAAPTSSKELRASLLEAAGGKPVLLALDGKGQLVARTADGGFTRVLLAGPYGDAAPDADRDLVWLRDDHKLDVLDLRGKALAPVTVVTFPDKAMEKLGQHITEPPTWTDTFVNVQLATPCGKQTGLRLEWAHNGESTADWAKGFRAVAKDWFAAESKRAKHPLGADPYPSAVTKRKVPKTVGTCRADAKEEYGKSRCGQAIAFGATGAELVVTGADADRCPATSCGLYDPKAKKFAAVPGLPADDDDKAPTCGPFLFDSAGTSFLVADQACGPGPACAAVGKLAIGWLDGNRALDRQ
ncbi:MAG TPA: hypothetical protein VGD37_20675 [Kofleriaceae bacterium]